MPDLLAGGGDHPDGVAASGADALADLADAGVLRQTCTDSTAAQRTSREPCLLM